ncbi:dienelactone hydrolase family protein [Mariniluteicoccus endophyticus]
MAHILLLHSALGLRPAVLDAADRLRALGHGVTTPDYYDGHVFDEVDAGIAYRDEVGERALLDRARNALADVPDDAVLAGFSLGAFFAQVFAAKRPAARAAVLLHAAAGPRGDWNGVPVQVHRYATDPWIEGPDVTALGEAVRASGAAFEDIVVPGEGHLFTDLGQPNGDADAYAASIGRIHAFIC